MFGGLLRAMRPHQWVKNLFVLTPILFAKELFDPTHVLRAAAGFLAFCFAASAVYLLNDVTDLEADRAHPVKRSRPIASGQVAVPTAVRAALVLMVVSLGGGFLLSPWFSAITLGYLLQNVVYSKWLKKLPYVDVLSIAVGFELRVLAGAVAAQVVASDYLLIVTFLLALFLGLGKRMHELRQGEAAHKQRAVLKGYRKGPVTVMMLLAALATVSTYAVYTLDPSTQEFFGTNRLVWTTPFTLAGVLRFLALVRGSANAESPTEEMLRDVPFLANLALWTASIFFVIYLGGS